MWKILFQFIFQLVAVFSWGKVLLRVFINSNLRDSFATLMLSCQELYIWELKTQMKNQGIPYVSEK